VNLKSVIEEDKIVSLIKTTITKTVKIVRFLLYMCISIYVFLKFFTYIFRLLSILVFIACSFYNCMF